MAINPKSKGTNRYYREHLVHRAVQEAQRMTGTTIMVSQAKAMRERMEQRLGGQSFGYAPHAEAMAAISAVIEESTGVKDVLLGSAGTVRGERWTAEFRGMLAGNDKAGPRLPISPYDPRWSSRSTVKLGGSAQSFVTGDDVRMIAGEGAEADLSALETWDDEGFELRRFDEEGAQIASGMAMSHDDYTGMTEFAEFMPEADWRKARDWVNRGVRTDGVFDRSKTMRPDARRRAMAILRELSSQGVPFQVLPDVNPGQLRVAIGGTDINVRVADVAAQDSYVGHRVYDDGVQVYFATPGVQRGTVLGLDRDDESYNRGLTVRPSPQNCVDLLRFVQGLPVRRFDDPSKEVGRPDTYLSQRGEEVSSSYYTDNGTASFVYADVTSPDGSVVPGAKMMIHRDSTSRTARFTRRTPESSEAFLKEAIETARENLLDAIDVEGLVEQYDLDPESAQAGERFPDFSGDPEISAIQRSYWDVLRGQQSMLLRPGATEDEFRELTGAIGQELMTEEEAKARVDALAEPIAYTGTPEEMVRAHAADIPDGMIGDYDLHPVATVDGLVDQRFNPSRVSKYMTSEYGVFHNTADIVWAVKAVEIEPDELMGSDRSINRIKDRMIDFDPSTAVPAASIEDPFVRSMAELVGDTVQRSGAEVVSVMVDDKGVVRWEAERYTRSGERKPLVGEVGQLFGRDEMGTVRTRFGSGDDYVFVPGYEARIAAQEPGEAKSVEERTVLRGYEEIMAEKVRYQVVNDVASKIHGLSNTVGEPTSLNSAYRSLYDVRHEVDFVERSREQGMEDSLIEAIIATEARRVRYGNDVREGSTANAEHRAQSGKAGDPANDSFGDPWVLTGGRNMAIMGGETSLGYFDDVLTSGSINQGITRYLVESASVGADGRIVKGLEGDRAPLAKHEVAQNMRFDPVDRQQMTFSNLMKARQVTPPTGIAMRTLGGWNFDDGFVISKEFAEEHELRGADGNLRPLQVGDKLSDLHGNKGVISLIVDREMEADQAAAEGITEAVDLFGANGELHVVISPFSAVSRFNGGSARELMERSGRLYAHPEHDDGVSGGIGEARLIITDHASDEKTNIYGEEEVAQGRGRRASAQLAWALSSQGADQVMAEFYGGNSSAVSNVREMLIAVGMDMAPDGTLQMGRWTPEQEGLTDPELEGSRRRWFGMPDLQLRSNGGLNTNAMRKQYGAMIGDKGGDFAMPFAMSYPAVDEATPARQLEQVEDGSWSMPVLSAHMRSGTELDDGVVSSHEYTSQYMRALSASSTYRFNADKLAAGDLTPKQRMDAERALVDSTTRGQSAFGSISNSIRSRFFEGKRNAFKEVLMSARLPHSATAVWTADPRLSIDQVAMSTAMADQLGFREGDRALIWRDPVLRDSGVRYMRVAIDDRLTGVAINPVMDKSFDGDFDGDAVAVVRLTSPEARRQAEQLLTVEANLVDLGSYRTRIDPETGEPSVDPETGLPEAADAKYPLNMQDSLDVKAAQHVNPELAAKWERLTQRANDVRFDFDEGEITRDEMLVQNREIMAELDEYYASALNEPGLAEQTTLSFDSIEHHVDSVRAACIDTGAKGSEAKLEAYQRYAGIDPATKEVHEGSLATREDAEGVWFALQAKAFGTGIAGAYSQRGVKAGRNAALTAVLELTYPVTQSMLQAKHDPEEARHKYAMLMGPARDLWKGRQLVRGEDGWEALRDSEGNEVQADVKSWRKAFYEFYAAPDGLNVKVNPEHIMAVGEALSHEGRMLDMEDPEMLAEAGREDLGSPMDRLAYGGGFELLTELAQRRVNIFEGYQNGHFAPYTVRRNQMEKRHAEMGLTMEPQYVDIGDRTSRQDGPSKGQGRRIDAARAVRAPKPLDAQEIFGRPIAPESVEAAEGLEAQAEALPGYEEAFGTPHLDALKAAREGRGAADRARERLAAVTGRPVAEKSPEQAFEEAMAESEQAFRGEAGIDAHASAPTTAKASAAPSLDDMEHPF